MWRESAYHLGGIAAAAAHDLNLLHEDSIAGAFLEGISGKPEDFDRFVRHIKWQLRQSGTPVSDRVVVYDSWGSGKSALLVVSALCTLYPDIEVKFLLGSVYNEGQLPSVQGEYESRYHARLDGSWPFAEMLNPDTGEVEILMGKDAGPRPDVALTESAAQVLAAYNMAMRIEEGHDIEDMEDLLLRPDMTDEAAVDFLFPS